MKFQDNAKQWMQCKTARTDKLRNFHLTKLIKYSHTTATSAMIRHLFDVHEITVAHGKPAAAAIAVPGASKASGSDDGCSQMKLDFSGMKRPIAARQAAKSTLNEDILMWLATAALPFLWLTMKALNRY